MPALRLMSYNVRSMRDDRAALARVIRAERPDVVLVQESPRFARWRSLCAALARTSNLVVVGGGRPAGSNLVLSSLGVDVESVRPVLFTTDARLHQRGTVIATLRLRGSRLAVAGIHLDLVEPARLRHVDELEAALSVHVDPEVPVIVAGDVNDRPGSAVWRRLADARPDAWDAAGEGDGFTSTATTPHQRIDGVFVDRRVRVVAAHVVDSPDVRVASDHRPVVVDLELP